MLRSVPVNALARPAPTPEPVAVAAARSPIPPRGRRRIATDIEDAAAIIATDPEADAGADVNIEAASAVDPAVNAAAEAVTDGSDVEVPVAETDEEATDKPGSATAEVAGRSGEEPAAAVATSIETVVIAPEATVDDAGTAAAAIGANAAAPVEADTLIAETNVTPSVPDNTSDNPPWNSLVSDWTGSVKLLRSRFGELDEQELLATNGDRNQVVSLMENRLGIDREEARTRLDDFARSPDGS